jgi:hypothetical protein
MIAEGIAALVPGWLVLTISCILSETVIFTLIHARFSRTEKLFCRGGVWCRIQHASFATEEDPFFALGIIREHTHTVFAAVNVLHCIGCPANLPAVDRGGIESVNFCIIDLSACRCLCGYYRLGATGKKKSGNKTDAHKEKESFF